MSFNDRIVVLTLLTAIAAPAPAWAFGGGAGGCSNLPEIYRAQGALQGMPSACDMSVEEARRILAAQGDPAYQQAAPAPVARHRRHKVLQPQQ